MTLTLKQKIDDFVAVSTAGEFRLSAHRGRIVVLYFYPKDSTPGCTVEGQEFALEHGKFEHAGARVVGVSRDSLKSHQNFKAKLALPFELIADVDEALCGQFDVIKQKTMYGKPVRGIERSTFVIDGAGKLAAQWRGVKVAGHVSEVLAFVESLK